MAVRIRLSRVGSKNSPCWRIVAIDSRRKRDGAYLDHLGTYDPIKHKFFQFHEEKIDDWLKKGAICTLSAKKIIKMKRKMIKTAAPVE